MPRRPDLPCAACGKLMWRGTGSRPEGEAVCQPCRRQQHGTSTRYKAGCRCDECRAENAAGRRRVVATYRAKHGRSLNAKHRTPRDGHHGHYVTRAVRLSIYERDDWVCQLCSEPVDPTLAPNGRMSATLDHIEPRSLALIPNHSPENLRLAHRACNSRRRNRIEEEVTSRAAS